MQRTLRKRLRKILADGGNAGADGGHRRDRPAEYRLEHEKQHDREQQRSGNRMQHDRIEACEPLHSRRYPVVDLRKNAPHFALGGLDIAQTRQRRDRRNERRRKVAAVDGINERALAAAAHGDGLDDRHADRALKRGAIEVKAARDCKVAHVERDDQRAVQALQIQHQPQIESQVRRIDHAHEKIGLRLAGVAAEHDIARNGFIKTRRLEAVGAGQIEHAVDAPRVRTGKAAFLALDGDAGVVRDFLTTAGEAIKKGGLAAIRDADQRKARASRHGRSVHVLLGCESSTQTVSTSRRRRAKVVVPTRTIKGSRPGRASVRISTRSPVTKPSSIRRRSSVVLAPMPTPMTTPLVPGGKALRLQDPGARVLPPGAATASMWISMIENRSHLQ